MPFGMSSVTAAALKEQEQKAAKEKEKKDTDAVGKLLVNTDLPPAKIAEITGTNVEFVNQANEKIQR